MEEALLGLPPFRNGTFSSKCDYNTARNLYSVAAPILVFISIINNVLYIFLVNYIKDDRSATTIQSTGIAISNSLIGIAQLPIFVSFFGQNNQTRDISTHWCNAYRILGYVLPNIFHTASMWQLTLYGVQRFLCFRFPFSAYVWYKIDRFFNYTMIIYCFATLIHIYKFFDFVMESGSPCTLSYRSGINNVHYILFYHWFCVLTIHLIPCIVMTICIFLLLYAIRLTYLRRKRVFANSQTAGPRNRKFTLQECQAIGTLTLVLCVEWPMAVIVILHVTNQYLLSIDCLYSAVITAHFALLASHPLYFPLYLMMNFELRNIVLQVVTDARSFIRRLRQ